MAPAARPNAPLAMATISIAPEWIATAAGIAKAVNIAMNTENVVAMEKRGKPLPHRMVERRRVMSDFSLTTNIPP